MTPRLLRLRVDRKWWVLAVALAAGGLAAWLGQRQIQGRIDAIEADSQDSVRHAGLGQAKLHQPGAVVPDAAQHHAVGQGQHPGVQPGLPRHAVSDLERRLPDLEQADVHAYAVHTHSASPAPVHGTGRHAGLGRGRVAP